MSTNRAGILAWAAKQTRDFNQLCQAFVYQACKAYGVAIEVYSSANAARADSGKLNTKASSASFGDIGYWKLGAEGHVAISLGGDLWLMGSAHAVSWVGGSAHHIGTATVAQYSQRAGATWLGWARTDGKNFITVTPPKTSTASTGTTKPVTPPAVITPQAKEEDMKIVQEKGLDPVYLLGELSFYHLTKEQLDNYLPVYGPIVGVPVGAAKQYMADIATRVAALPAVSASVDIAPIQSSIAQLASQLGTDVASIEAAVKAIPANPTEVIIPAVTAQLK